MGLSVSADAQCTFTIDGQDSWGDGWNGGSIDIYVDGVVTNWGGPPSTIGSTSFSVITGDSISFTFNAGGFVNEVSYQIYDNVGGLLGGVTAGSAVGGSVTYAGSALCVTCGAPSNIVTSVVDNDTLFVAWDPSVIGAMSYEMEWGPVGFTPGTGTVSTGITGTNDTIGGLMQLTDYDVYLFTDCGADSSNVVGPITLSTGPNCSDVSGITIDGSSADSLFLSWTSNGSEIMWDVEYGVTGYVAGTGTVQNNTILSDTIVGLMSGVTYDFYVRSDCGGVDQGVWIGPVSYTTGCVALTPAVLPFVEDFEAASFTQIGDSLVYCGTDKSWMFTTTDQTLGRLRLGTDAVTALAGAGSATLDMSTSGSVTTNYLDLTLDLSTYASSADLHFSCKLMNHGDENSAEDRIWVRGSKQDTWIEILNWYNAIPGSGVTYNVVELNISTALTGALQVPTSSFQVRIGQQDNFPATSPTGSDGLTIDDVRIEEVTCLTPTDLAQVSSMADTIIVDWTVNGSETQWDIEYGPVGFTSGSGTMYSTTSNADTVTGLTQGGLYDFYVRANCGAGDLSNWFGPVILATELLNDDACGAIFVPVDATQYIFSNIGATTESSESFFGLGNTVWFKTVVPASGHFAITTCGSPIRTELNVYDSVPDCNDLSTTSNYLSTTSNAYGCGFGYASGEICDFNAGDTVYFTMDSYSFGDGEGVFSMILFDLEYEAGTGGVVDACAGDTVNLESYNSGTVSLFPGYWDYPANPNVIFDDSLANTSNFTLGAADAFYIVGNTCMQDTAIVTVNVATASNSGVAIDPFNGCNTGDVFLMDGLTGTIDAGGSWNDDLNTGLLVGGVFVANGLPVGQYQFTYTADNGACPAVSTQVTVDLNNCVGVEENIATFNLFPNPNNGSFFITSSTSDIANITITDAQGKLISTQQINLEAGLQSKMEVSSVESGLYLISIEIAGAVSTQTFIIK